VQERTFGKQGKSGLERPQVSHGSHRVCEWACVKQGACVESVSRGAWLKGMQQPRDAQETSLPQLAQGEENPSLSVRQARFPIKDSVEFFYSIHSEGAQINF